MPRIPRTPTPIRRNGCGTFLLTEPFVPDEVKMTYTHVDRMIVGSAMPVRPLALEAGEMLHATYFLERREMGIINIGAPGTVSVDGNAVCTGAAGCPVYREGRTEIAFASGDPADPALFYFNSTPAHQSYPYRAYLVERRGRGRWAPWKSPIDASSTNIFIRTA